MTPQNPGNSGLCAPEAVDNTASHHVPAAPYDTIKSVFCSDPLKDYPPGTNLYLRAEPLHPGATPTLLDVDGHRITAFLGNSGRWHGPALDARHRARGRCENRIKTLKNTGLGKLPFTSFAANQAWALIAALAMNLTAWLQLSCLPAAERARFWDIKRWRYRLFATAGKITRHGRSKRLLLPQASPEKDLIAALVQAIARLAKPPATAPT